MSATILAMSEPSVLANTAMRRRPFSRWIWLGPSVSTTVATASSGMRPAGLSISILPSARVERSASLMRRTTSKRLELSATCETTRPLDSVSSASITVLGFSP